MIIRWKDHQENAMFLVMQIINQNLEINSKEIAQKVRISIASAYYLLKLIIITGFSKLLICGAKKDLL